MWSSKSEMQLYKTLKRQSTSLSRVDKRRGSCCRTRWMWSWGMRRLSRRSWKTRRRPASRAAAWRISSHRRKPARSYRSTKPSKPWNRKQSHTLTSTTIKITHSSKRQKAVTKSPKRNLQRRPLRAAHRLLSSAWGWNELIASVRLTTDKPRSRILQTKAYLLSIFKSLQLISHLCSTSRCPKHRLWWIVRFRLKPLARSVRKAQSASDARVRKNWFINRLVPKIKSKRTAAVKF